MNGSPQNTFHPAIIEYARQNGSLLAGSDFKSGQTRFKTIMSDFLIGSGLRLASCVSEGDVMSTRMDVQSIEDAKVEADRNTSFT